MHLQEKTISSDVKYEGPIFTITHDTAELENGKTAVRDILHHHGGVCVIPITENNEIFLVKQFRYPFQTVTREVPAGYTVIGGKTGTTEAAGKCLILYFKDSEENPYIACILKSEDYDTLYADMDTLISSAK